MSFAQIIVLEGEKEVSSLGASLSYFINSEEKDCTIEEISNQNFDNKWLKSEISNQSELSNWHLVLDKKDSK